MLNDLFERELRNTTINGVSLADYIIENYIIIAKRDVLRDMNEIMKKEKIGYGEKEQDSKWIPVSKELPKQYGNYLVSIDGDEIDIGTIVPDAKNKGWSLCDVNGFYWATEKGVKITAWMPLPKPYKPQESEK